jgi:hypothetical protein
MGKSATYQRAALLIVSVISVSACKTRDFNVKSAPSAGGQYAFGPVYELAGSQACLTSPSRGRGTACEEPVEGLNSLTWQGGGVPQDLGVILIPNGRNPPAYFSPGFPTEAEAFQEMEIVGKVATNELSVLEKGAETKLTGDQLLTLLQQQTLEYLFKLKGPDAGFPPGDEGKGGSGRGECAMKAYTIEDLGESLFFARRDADVYRAFAALVRDENEYKALSEAEDKARGACQAFLADPAKVKEREQKLKAEGKRVSYSCVYSGERKKVENCAGSRT